MKIKAIGFDLDNTLYDEQLYIDQAYMAIALKIENDFRLNREIVFEAFSNIRNKKGDKNLFQDFFHEFGINCTREYILDELVPLYHSVDFKVELYPNVVKILLLLKEAGIKLGMVTNGGKKTQQNKINLLNIDHLFDTIIITGEYFAKENWKPSELPFKMFCDNLNVKPSESLFIGDSIKNDMQGALNSGLHFLLVKKECIDYDMIYEKILDKYL